MENSNKHSFKASVKNVEHVEGSIVEIEKNAHIYAVKTGGKYRIGYCGAIVCGREFNNVAEARNFLKAKAAPWEILPNMAYALAERVKEENKKTKKVKK